MDVDTNFKLIVEYDGSAYHGWQRQKKDITIQGEIESAVTKLTAQKITLIGSGRTDAGVHAKGQVANFHCVTRLSAEKIQQGLNALLPDDIVIIDCRVVHEGFHARFDVIKKTYRYTILNRPVAPAIGRQYVWHVRQPLNPDTMRAGLSYIIGEHDFKAFEGVGSPRATTVRTLFQAELQESENGRLDFFFTADGFLKHMVRNIVGSLVDVGRGRTEPKRINTVLAAEDRSLAGATAPGRGLCLMHVNYGDTEMESKIMP